MRKLIIVSIALASLTGCSTVLTETKNSVSYEYTNDFVPSTDIVKRASAHCNEYGKEAELRSRSTSGSVSTDIFDCK